MSVADNLRKIREAAHPIVERQINTLWCVNLICMTAFRHGFIDELWNSHRQSRPNWRLYYFIRSRGLGDIKIGRTNNLIRRFDHLRHAMSRGADLIACYPGDPGHEAELHADFKRHRLNGEWFAPHEDLLDYLRMIGGDVNLINLKNLDFIALNAAGD